MALRLSAACLLACGVTARAREPARFLLLTPFVDYPFFAPMKQGAADAAKALGVEVTFAGTADGNVKALADQAEASLTAGYAGIGINMIDANAFDVATARRPRRPCRRTLGVEVTFAGTPIATRHRSLAIRSSPECALVGGVAKRKMVALRKTWLGQWQSKCSPSRQEVDS